MQSEIQSKPNQKVFFFFLKWSMDKIIQAFQILLYQNSPWIFKSFSIKAKINYKIRYSFNSSLD